MSSVCRQLKLTAKDGKKYLTDVIDDGVLNLLTAIHSSKKSKVIYYEITAPPLVAWLRQIAKIERNDKVGNQNVIALSSLPPTVIASGMKWSVAISYKLYHNADEVGNSRRSQLTALALHFKKFPVFAYNSNSTAHNS